MLNNIQKAAKTIDIAWEMQYTFELIKPQKRSGTSPLQVALERPCNEQRRRIWLRCAEQALYRDNIERKAF